MHVAGPVVEVEMLLWLILSQPPAMWMSGVNTVVPRRQQGSLCPVLHRPPNMMCTARGLIDCALPHLQVNVHSDCKMCWHWNLFVLPGRLTEWVQVDRYSVIAPDCLLDTTSHTIQFLCELESIFWASIKLISSNKSLLFFSFKSSESSPWTRLD